MKVKEYINQFIITKNTKQVFGVSGANIEELYEEIFHSNKGKIILAKNEYNAATMAFGSYFVNKKPAFVLTTSGPGILNTIPVLAEGFTSKIPLILISGLIPNNNEGNGAFQDTSGKNGTINIVDMLTSCTSTTIKIENAIEIKQALNQAYKMAIETLQPTVILVPKNLFNDELDSIDIISEELDVEVLPKFNLPLLENFCDEFANSIDKNPLIILGEELLNLNDLTYIKEFSKNISAYIALTTNAKGLYDHLADNFLGITGIMGHIEVKNFIEDASHIIMIGCKFDLLDSFGVKELLNGKKVFQIRYQSNLNSIFKKLTIKHQAKKIINYKKHYSHAIICVAQTAGGRIFGQEDTRQLAQSAIPGDGFAVAYVTNTAERPFLTFEFENYPDFSEDMKSSFKGKHWWESRENSGQIDFNEEKSAMIIGRGNKTVPKMIKKVCANLDIKHSEIDYLITNQPNTNFLRNWREAISLPPERQLQTFDKYANLFGAAIPVNLAIFTKNKTLKPGDLVCLAGFSHACDYSAAALIRWT